MAILLNKFKNINSHLNPLFLKISIVIAFGFFIIISLFHYFTNDSDKIIPRNILFGPADKTNVQLSSDGKYISYLAPDQNVIKLWITPINDLSKARIIINNTERGIRHYYWSGSRDYFGFNNLHQWLANRGYTVLSVNFHGSTGFGKQFLNAGNMEWGGKMQDDLIDAVNWVYYK
ncbi:MAG: hypothetical protein EKK61_02950 [Rickettsiales bacterium]|nr:MAG: hypothetical protein EKK61_02950 [Rickettsiales bacterium]